MKCRNCEADNPDDAIICGKCGATMPTVPGAKALISEESFDSIPLILGIVGFFMMVAGAWMIGGQAGAGAFFALLGAVVLAVTLLYSLMPRK